MLGHNQTMLVAALDTTTRVGSLALVRDQHVLATLAGDGDRPHATRLPGDLLRLLTRQGLGVADVDVFAIATGPGSFTGLRIGLAAVQGLAFASGKPVVGVSAFEALATAVWVEEPDTAGAPLAIWIDGQRQEVFAAVLQMTSSPAALPAVTFEYLEEPSVGRPSVVLDRWTGQRWWGTAAFAGDGVLVYREVLEPHLGATPRLVAPTPLLAPSIGAIAERRAVAGEAAPPHAVRPLYVRRPDAELARDRQRAGQA